jgi:hypothetical protein
MVDQRALLRMELCPEYRSQLHKGQVTAGYFAGEMLQTFLRRQFHQSRGACKQFSEDLSSFRFASVRHQKSPDHGLSVVAGTQSPVAMYQSIRQQAREANLRDLERRSWHNVKPKEKRRQQRMKREQCQKSDEFRTLVGVAMEMMQRYVLTIHSGIYIKCTTNRRGGNGKL